MKRFAMLFVIVALAGCSATHINFANKSVLIGDSITNFWQRYDDFPAHHWIDEGVPGETCSQLATRFETDVLDQAPDVVHIMCGTNDINGGYPLDLTKASILQMVALAQKNHIRVVLATIPYIEIHFVVNSESNNKVAVLNSFIKSLGLPYADYNKALTGRDGLLIESDTIDGIHPNAAGYSVMMPLAVDAIWHAEVRKP